MARCTLLDAVRDAVRVRQYGSRTGQAYVYWIKRFIRCHRMHHTRDMGASELGAYLHLVVRRQITIRDDRTRKGRALQRAVRSPLDVHEPRFADAA